jgi:hypothetical protein
MNFAQRNAATETAIELFELAFTAGARSEEEFSAAYDGVVKDVLRMHPGMPTELIAYSCGFVMGRLLARRCDCVRRPASKRRLQ